MTFQPLRVRAHLAGGIAHAAPWGIALDGLLASELWARSKAGARDAGQTHQRALEQDDPPDLPLPLARCAADPTWHWSATCAYPEDSPGRIDVRTWMGRVDRRALEQTSIGLPKTVSDRQGRYRARRMPLLVTPCRSVTWHAVGDVDAVTELLEGLDGIGKKRGSGEGNVLRWEITPAPDLDPYAAAHLHPDGTLGRPTPPGCLQGRAGILDGGLGRAGIRPPYMHPARQQQLHLPALLGS
jgi:CRISPR type IV-associated protein Csf3